MVLTQNTPVAWLASSFAEQPEFSLAFDHVDLYQ